MCGCAVVAGLCCAIGSRACRYVAILTELIDQRIGELCIGLLQRCVGCRELRCHPPAKCGRQRRANLWRHCLERADQLLDSIGRMRCAYLHERPAPLAIGKSGREQRGRHDTANEDEKHATLHRRDECLHDVVSIFTSALNT